MGKMSVDHDVRSLLGELRSLVQNSGHGLMYGDRAKALEAIDAVLEHPDNNRLKLILAPTGNIQELSIEYGWGNEFLQISAGLERALGLS